MKNTLLILGIILLGYSTLKAQTVNLTWNVPASGEATKPCGGILIFTARTTGTPNIMINFAGFCSPITYDWDVVSYIPAFPSCSTPLPQIQHPTSGTYSNNPPPCTNPPSTACGPNANIRIYNPGFYVFRLCISSTTCSQSACSEITLRAVPPTNYPPEIVLEDITTLTLPIDNTERLDATVSDPTDAHTFYWVQDGANPMPISLPIPGNAPSNPISRPRGVAPTLSQVDISQISKPGNYCFTVNARDEFNANSSATECFLVRPAPSSLGISITPPGTAPDPNVLYTPINNVPLNSQITGINVYNDRIRYEWSQISGPTAISMPPAAYTANINDIPVSSSTFNLPPLNLNALAYGTYVLRLTVEDEYYAGSTITQDITFEVKPPESNLAVTVNPASETTIDPYNNFTFSGQVTGINVNSDVIITYWRGENGNPSSIALPHTMASPNSIPLGTTTFEQSVTMNQRITEGTYEFWFVAKDVFYNVGDSAKVRIIVKPGESTFALTIDPNPEKRVVKTPEGFIFNEGEDPQNTPFSVKSRVTGISDKTDYVRTYWRMEYEPELPDQDEQLRPTLPHTASAMKSIDLGVTSDESEVVFNLSNCSAGTYTLHFVARDVFYNTTDSVSTKIIVTKPVSIEPAAMFSPNGDGQNDVWFVKNVESFPFLGVKIINERGELVFETESLARLPEKGWNGRRKDGKLATEGAYYYQFYDTRDQKIFNVGSFVLLR